MSVLAAIVSIILIALFWRLFAALAAGTIMIVGIAVVILALAMSGCASNTPETTAMCTTRYTLPQEIESCKVRVVHREDMRFQRRMRAERADACQYPAIWDGRYEVCRGSIFE